MISSVIAWFLANYVPFISVYVGGGAGYALLKWIIQLLRLRTKVLEINSSDIAEDNSDSKNAFNNKKYNREQATRELFGSGSSYPPKASENKGKLFTWAVFWPFNLVYTLFADVAREVWSFLYRKLGSLLDRISTAILPK